MLTCKEASYLASKKLDSKLSWRELVEFKLHTAMCTLCRRYAKEVKNLHKIVRRSGGDEEALLSESERLSEEARARIKQTLEKPLEKLSR